MSLSLDGIDHGVKSPGGHVYRGAALDDLIGGAYIFGDDSTNNIYYIKDDGNGAWIEGTIISDGSVPIIGFTEDNDVREKEGGRGVCK